MADVIALGGGFGSANSYGGFGWGEANRQALQNTLLVVANASHSHTADNVVLVQQHVLTVQDASHSHTVDNVVLVQQHNLAVDNSTHSLTSDTFWLIYNTSLAVDNALHAHTVDNIALIQQHTIVVDNTTHSTSSDNLSLIQQQVLAVSNASHNVLFDGNLLLNQFLLMNKPDDSVHSLKSDNLILTGNHFIVIDDTRHRFVLDEPGLVNWAALKVFFGGYIPDLNNFGSLTQAQIDELGRIYRQLIYEYGTLATAEVALGGYVPNIVGFGELLQAVADSGGFNPTLGSSGTLDSTDATQYGGIAFTEKDFGKLLSDEPQKILKFEDGFIWLSEDGQFVMLEEKGNTNRIDKVSEYGTLKQGTIEYGQL